MIKGILTFYIDVGNLDPFKADALLDHMKDNFDKQDNLTERLRQQGYECIWIPVRPNSQTRIELTNLSTEAPPPVINIPVPTPPTLPPLTSPPTNCPPSQPSQVNYPSWGGCINLPDFEITSCPIPDARVDKIDSCFTVPPIDTFIPQKITIEPRSIPSNIRI